MKPLLSGLLGFATVMALSQTQIGTSLVAGNQGQPKMLILFAAVMIVQTLFEILSKYYGKTCEMTEGIFTGIVALGGYFLVSFLADKAAGMGGRSTSSGRGSTSGYGAAPGAGATYGYGQYGGAIQNGIIGAVGVGLAIWVWKRFLKSLILPQQCPSGPECPECPPAPPCPPCPVLNASQENNKEGYY